VKAKAGAEDEIIEFLGDLTEIVEIYKTYGPYNIFARVNAETMQEMEDFIKVKINGLKSVETTIQLVIISKLYPS
jgi:DNA-binding Lrp family transcriptional regulator